MLEWTEPFVIRRTSGHLLGFRLVEWKRGKVDVLDGVSGMEMGIFDSGVGSFYTCYSFCQVEQVVSRC